MKQALVLIGVALMAMPAMADLITATATPFEGDVVTYGPQSSRTVVVYDDTVTASGYYYNQVGLECGDDLAMTAGGPVDHFEFGYYDPAALPDATAATVRMYDMATFVGMGADVPLCTYNVPLPGVSGAWLMTFTPAAPFCAVPQNIVMSVQFDNTVNCGLLIYDPPVVGTSADMFWKNDGTGNWYWFGGPPNPVANFCLEVEIVPEPASLALLALGGLLLRRR